MPKKKIVKKFNYPIELIEKLILDIDEYKKFLPWCNYSRIVSTKENDKNKKLGALISGSIFFLFSYILINGFDGEIVISSGSSTELLGEILLSRFVFPFELVSFVLLAALIGGITLARKDEALIDEDQV